MKNQCNLKGKTAWITGGKRVGQRVAEILAQNGCNIILSYNKSKKEAESTQKNLKTLKTEKSKAFLVQKIPNEFSWNQKFSGHRKSKRFSSEFKIKTLVIQCDVSSRKSVADAVNQIKKEFKKIDILVLMASIFEKKGFHLLSENDFRRNFEVHVLGTLFPIQLCFGMMPKGSHIMTVSDEATMGKYYEGYLPYLISKNAVNYLTKALSEELNGVYINTIAPGPVLKPKGLSKKRWTQIKKELNCRISDEEAVDKFAQLALKLSTIKSTGNIYKLDSKKFKL